MSRWFIYGLIDPRTKLVRYVGQTSSGMRRPRHHRAPSQLRTKKTHRSTWIRSLLKLGLDYEVAVLEAFDGPGPLNDAECWWIAYGLALGWGLTNHTNGGGGTRGLVFSPVHRARLSAAHVGRTLTEQHRQAISKGNVGRVISAFVRERTAKSNRAREWTDDSREKLSAAKRGRRPDPAQGQRHSERMIGTKHTAETRKRMSDAHKGTRHTEAARMRMSLAKRRSPKLRINLLGAA